MSVGDGDSCVWVGWGEGERDGGGGKEGGKEDGCTGKITAR